MPQLQPDKKKISADDINTAYKQRYITAEQRNKGMRRLAGDQLEEMIGEHGMAFSYFKQTLKHVNDNWAELLKIADEYKPADDIAGEVGQRLKIAGKVMWREIGILTAPLMAFGEVNGKVAEHYALQAGASPGLAKVINVAVDVGSGFIPVGKLSQAFAKGVQTDVPIAKAIGAKIGSKVSSSAGKTAGAADNVMDTAKAEQIVDDAITQGLKADGVEVFHGSPHTFDKFDVSKVGTGEGSQVYGHGLYFAENRAVAENYAKEVANDILRSGRSVVINPKGNIYRATIPQEQIGKMLDWDKPLSEQSATIQKAMQSVVDAAKKSGLRLADDNAGTILAAARHELGTGGQVEKLLSDAGIPGIKYLDQGSRAAGEGTRNFVVFSEEILQDAARVVPPSTQHQFLSDLRKFKAEMAHVTETKTHEMTAKEAEKLGLTIEDLKGWLGEKVSEAEMYAYLKALDGPVNSMIDNAKAGLAGNEAAGNAAMKTLQEFFEYSPKFRKAEVTAGRSVEILKETPPMKPITEMMRGWAPEDIAKMDFEAAKKTILEDLVEMGDTKLKALQVTTDKTVQGATFWEKAREGYINLLLAPPVSQTRNFIGNSYTAMNSTAERELAGWLSIDEAKGVVKGEGYAQFQGMMAAMGDGFKAFGEAYKTVGDDAGKLDFIPHKIGGTWGRIVNVPGDTMRGMDNFFKTILQRGDIYAQALNQGRHLGLDKGALADYAARHAAIPSQSMIEHAKDFALNQTFQNDLGTLGSAAKRLLQTGPMVLLFPFMKTPMNLAKYAWNRTPGLQFLSGSLYDDILAGGQRADMAIARLTLSNMMGMFWYGLAQQGLLTGGGPVDPGLRRTWGKQPYAFTGTDAYWQPGQLDPATTSIWMAADFAEVMNQLDDPTAEQTAMAIGLAGVRDIVDKSYWQTVGQAVDFVGAVRSGEEPGRQAMRLIQGPLVTFSSGGPLVARVARAIDPVRREARGFMDQVRSRVPGYSATLPPMRDGWGDPIVPPQPLGGGWVGLISPLSAKGYEQDAIKKEGARLQAKIPLFPWSIGGKSLDDFDIRTALPGDPLPVDLSPQQRDRWQVIYREILRHPENGIEAVLLNNPEYQNTPIAGQRNAYMNFLSVARQGAKDALMVEDSTLARKTAEATAGKYLPMLRPEMRPQVEAQISEGLDMMESLAPQERANLEAFGIMGDGAARDEQSVNIQLQRTTSDQPAPR